MSDWLTEKLLKQIDEQDAEIRRLQAKAKEMQAKLEKASLTVMHKYKERPHSSLVE